MKSRLDFKHFQLKDHPERFCIFEVTYSEKVFRKLSKKSRFRGCFDKQYGKRDQALLKSESEQFYYIHWSMERKLCSKKSLLLTCKIMGLLVNTLATDEIYLVHHQDNLTLPIQIQFSKKKKTFSQFFAPFLKSRLNFQHFERKGDSHSICIFEILDSENVVT